MVETAPKKQSLDSGAESISGSSVKTLDPVSRFYGWRLHSLEKGSLQSLAGAVSRIRNWVLHEWEVVGKLADFVTSLLWHAESA